MTDLAKQQFQLKLKLELIFWALTLLLVGLLTYPLFSIMQDWSFVYANALFIVIFVTYTRHLFLLKYSFLAYAQWAKFVLIFASIPLIFKLIEYTFNFQDFMESEGLPSFTPYFYPEVGIKQQQQLLDYMKGEYLFFGVASIIAAILLPFRLLISYWRVYNKQGTV
ncbi:hypothetical protein [Saprospira grandis]|uniref:Uncharacterized protein n=1 Tax=Saprospira grandis (strain Lewin) TaxID=984262 RepID=H6KZD1_SAPGL|nr:hypothetical protein [Saprospira grandis]AFC24521.1 hypothetical protein SGRA_1786 [Saprospira grandis str. Lewin]